MSRMNRALRSALTGLAVAMVLAALVPTARAAPQDLLVGSVETDSVLRYDGATGAYLGAFVTAGSGRLNGPTGLALGPDGNLYVAGQLPNSVKRYDGITGAFIDDFAAGFSVGIGGIVFGPDGNLYGNLLNEDRVFRVDGTAGAFIDYFVPAGSGGLDLPTGLRFGPDGNLYVSSFLTYQVLRYDGTTGAFIDVFADACPGCAPGNPAFQVSSGEFGPDGHLYVLLPNTGNDILRFDGATGAPLSSFIPAGDPHPDGPRALVFGPDGNLYVSARDSDEVLRYDGTTGAFIDNFASGGGLDGPSGLVFTPPAPECADGIDNDGDGVTDFGSDLGCESETDDSEKGIATPGGWALVCDNGADDDGDGLVDYPSDPGCFSPASYTESPACSDGLDNDGDAAIDHPADPQCTRAWDTSERVSGAQCGIGFELAFVLPPLLWMYRRRRE